MPTIDTPEAIAHLWRAYKVRVQWDAEKRTLTFEQMAERLAHHRAAFNQKLQEMGLDYGAQT